ncbi:MAG TPA: DUF434 domain-containing protein [Kofleriaceae bacterium]|nr:DUF434 domain-containing protein [Kofleriaceae bacterium]
MSHRGPHPKDASLFAPAALPALREAVADLSWLRGRGYGDDGAIKLVGDRYQLRERARIAMGRCAASARDAEARRARKITIDRIDGPLTLDGFNVLVTGEAALSGGVILRGRDGALRDLSSVHGTYRRVEETDVVIAALATLLAKVERVTWLLDRPVSNSGRLAARLRDADARWQVELVDAVDPVLAKTPGVIATSDSWILDRCGAWIDLPAAIIASRAPDAPEAWVVEL